MRSEQRDQTVGGLLADRDGHGDRHAALAGGAEGGADQGVGGHLEVRVRHDHGVVLGPAEALGALAHAGGVRVDGLRDRGGADEADGLDARVLDERVHGGLVAVHHVEGAGGHAGLEGHLGQAHRDGGVALGGLEDEGVARRQGDAGLPQRDHRREVEGRDAHGHAERLADGVHVDAGARVGGELTLEQVRGARGELHDLDAALDVALGVREGLAVLLGEHGGQLVHVLVDQVDPAQQDAAAALRVQPRPRGEALLGGGQGGVDLLGGGQRHAPRHAARGRVVDVAVPAGGALAPLAVHEVGDHGGGLGGRGLLGHGGSSRVQAEGRTSVGAAHGGRGGPGRACDLGYSSANLK